MNQDRKDATMASSAASDFSKGVYRRIWACALNGRRINSVSERAEVLFWRLHLVADDYGRFSADPEWLKHNALPRRNISPKVVRATLQELADTGGPDTEPLVMLYTCRGDELGLIVGFEHYQPAGKNGRRVFKFPAPPGESGGIRGNPGESGGIQGDPGVTVPIRVGAIAGRQKHVQVQEQEQAQGQGIQPEIHGDNALPAPPKPAGPGELPADASLIDVLAACGVEEPALSQVHAAGLVTAQEAREAWEQAVQGSRREVRPVRNVAAAFTAALLRKSGIELRPSAHVGSSVSKLNEFVMRHRHGVSK